MKIDELEAFLALHGIGEYQVSVLPGNHCIVRPLTERQIIVEPEMIMEMIAKRDAKNGRLDL